MRPGEIERIPIVRRPPPRDNVSTSAKFDTLDGKPKALGRRSYDVGQGRTTWVLCTARLTHPENLSAWPSSTGLDAGIAQFVGKIKLGADKTAHNELSFDIPLNEAIAFPVSADFVDVSVRLVQRFSSPAVFSPPADNQQFSSGVEFSGSVVASFGPLSSSAIVTCTLADELSTHERASYPSRRYELQVTPGGGNAIKVPIPFGAWGVTVYGSSDGTWEIDSTFGGGDTVADGLPMNSPEPIPLPETAFFVQVTNNGMATRHFLVVYAMGF